MIAYMIENEKDKIDKIPNEVLNEMLEISYTYA